MAKVIIVGVDQRFDGEHELTMGKDAPLKNSELRTIKKIAGVRPSELFDALAATDIELHIALAVVALQRVGKAERIPPEMLAEVLFEGDAGSVVIDFRGDEERAQEQEAKERPPVSPTKSGSENEPAETASPSESETPSGATSGNGGESQEPHLKAIGE